MLPLDRLTRDAAAGFAANGIVEDDVSLAVELDLDLNGNFGESWLAADFEKKKLYIISVTSDAETENKRKFAREKLRKKQAKSAKRKKQMDNTDDGLLFEDLFSGVPVVTYDIGKFKKLYIEHYSSSNRLMAVIDDESETGTTIVVAYCTNARKNKLFAFVDLILRSRDGESIKQDDPIFDQFCKKCPKCGKVYPDQNRQICENCVNGSTAIKRLLGYFGKFKLQLVTVVICMFASSAISLLNPIIHGIILYDKVVSENGEYHNENYVYIVIGVIFAMALLSLTISIIQNRANAYMSTQVSKNMKVDIFTALQRFSLSYFNNTQTGKLMTRVDHDADRIRNFFIDGVPHLIVHGLNFIGLTIFLFIVNWKLTLIVFIPVPIIVCIFKFALPKLWKAYTKSWHRTSEHAAFLNDTLNGERVIKAFAKEATEANRFRGYNERLYEAVLRSNLIHLTIFPIIGLLIGLSSKAIWGFGGMQVMGGFMTYGALTTYLGYLGMIFGPLNFFTNFTNMLTETLNSAQRMFEILDGIPEISDAEDAVEFDRLRGEIEFKRVCFHYAPNRPVLSNVSFKIKPGQHVGLVGHTGSGKTTIANCVCRLYDVISGSIHIDGVDVKKIKTSVLRKNIAVVSQEIFIFRGTIADNIRYARPDATEEEVIAAAKAANAHDFIIALPDGYETIVGTGSRSLSGGERQRLSIARALLLSPSILILDEATAAMDTETERLIQEALNRVIEGRTTITIAHRLSTLKDCDYLYAIEHGKIAEEGTHAGLIAKKGLYYKLYTLQSEAMKKVISGM